MSSSEKNEPTLKVGSSEAPPLSVPPLLPFNLLTLFGFKLQGTDPMTQNQGDYVTIRGIQVVYSLNRLNLIVTFFKGYRKKGE